MWLVIGYGSTLNTDDRFGRVVAEELKAQVVNEDVEIISTNQLSPELIEPICKADGVIFVDASLNLDAGKLECKRLAGNGSYHQDTSSPFSHHLEPETLLQAADTLYGQAPPAWLYAVGGEDFEWGEHLSPCLEKMVPAVTALILNHIYSFRRAHVQSERMLSCFRT